MKFFISMGLNVVGCEGHEVFEAKDMEEAEQYGWEMAVQHASSYVEVADQDCFTEEEWIDFEAEHEGSYLGGYTTLQDIDYYVEEYDADKHDCMI